MSIAALIDRIRARYRWRFVGFVIGKRVYLDDDGKRMPGSAAQQIYALFERGDGKRRVDVTGEDLMSEHAVDARARVKAWKAGGPLPELDEKGTPAPPPKARKGAPKLWLVGGKTGDAA